MLGGFAGYLILVLIFPSNRLLWIIAWVVAFGGALIYFVATLPGVTQWLKSFWGKQE